MEEPLPRHKLATAFETHNFDHIFSQVFDYATRRARLDKDLGETSVGPDDVGQDIAISIASKLADGSMDDFSPGQFAGYVKSAVYHQRADFLRLAKDHRATHVELTFDEDDDEGNPETHDNPAVRQYVAYAPCPRLIPTDTTGIDPQVLAVMCESIRNKSTMHMEKSSRAPATAKGIAGEILRILYDEDEWVWDEQKPNYLPGSSDALDPDHPYGAWRLPRYSEVAQKLRYRGFDVTEEAVKQHMKRIRSKGALMNIKIPTREVVESLKVLREVRKKRLETRIESLRRCLANMRVSAATASVWKG